MADWYEERFRDVLSVGLRLTGRVFEGRSPFQRVEIVDTALWGRALVLDGIFQTAEREEFLYHEMLVHPAMTTAPSVRRVLVIGGGDGGTVREVLRHREVEQVVMIEIDPMVVEACQRHLTSIGTAWDDPRLDLRIADGVRYVQETDEPPFDVVILDGTDPVGPGEGLFDEAFYRGVARVLSPQGVFAAQTESAILMPEVFSAIERVLGTVFTRVHPYFGCTPIYGAGHWTWTYATNGADPMAIDAARLGRIEDGCRYYNGEVHAAAFAQPQFIRQLLDPSAGR